MKERKNLTIQMTIFFTFVFVIFSLIIISEKKNTLVLPKINSLMTNYINENYHDLEVIKSNITEENNIFSMKVHNKDNKNHYFYINYSNKKISDTYKKDYFEGATILNHLSKKLEKKIYSITNKNYKVTFDNTLNNYSQQVQNQLIKENITTLKIYTVEYEITTPWNKTTITNNITDIITKLEKNNITPKNYTITITNKDDITQAVKIKGLKITFIKNDNLSIIINDIINNNKSNILNENKITYEYLN